LTKYLTYAIIKIKGAKMDKFYRKLGERVKRLRGEVGLSQERLSRMLKMSRVSISQIENGERKIGAEEIAEIARIFNISPDVLLDFKRDIKVILEKKPEKKHKKEIRISVPQKNVEKFKEVLLYILNKVGSKPNIGETVTYKLLYFIDFNFYEKYEEQLIGATYIKNTYGPKRTRFN
jgi:transcriptional regulator with XRE-family HTH domain